MLHPYHFVFKFIHFISHHILVLTSVIFSSLSFQNLLLIQDHFHLASVISMCQLVNTLPMIPLGEVE